MSELRGLQLSLEAFRSAGTRIMAVCVDPVETNRAVAARLGLDFQILSDPDLVAIDAFGLRHTDASPEGTDVARPAIYLVRAGVVRWRDLTDNWRVRIRAEDLVEVAKRF